MKSLDSLTYPWPLIGLLALLVLAPLFRGLFFSAEQNYFLLTIAFLAIVYWRKHQKTLGRLEIALLLLAVANTLSLFWAATPSGALQETLKYTSYLLLMWMITSNLKRPADIRLLFMAIVVSGLLLAGIAIGAASGFLDKSGLLVEDRLASTLQYPNALATYLTACCFLSIGLTLSPAKTYERFIYPAASFCHLIAFVLTYSRGGWLVFPFLVMLFVLLLPRQSRLQAVVLLGALSVSSLLTLPLIAKGFENANPTMLWLPYLTGAALTPLLYIGGCRLLGGALGFGRRLLVPTLCLMAAGIAAIVLVLLRPASVAPGNQLDVEVDAVPGVQYQVQVETLAPPGTSPVVRVEQLSQKRSSRGVESLSAIGTQEWEVLKGSFLTANDTTHVRITLSSKGDSTVRYRDPMLVTDEGKATKISLAMHKILPSGVVARLFAINVFEKSSVLRLLWMRDSLKIISDYPIFGVGGGGWAAIYKKYQSWNYQTREVHSFLFQSWVETGTLGLGCIVYLALSYVLGTLRNIRNPGHFTPILVGSFMAVLGIMAHSMIDFNLSLPAVAFLLIGLLAASQSWSRVFDIQEKSVPRQVLTYVVPVAALALLVASAMLIVSSVQAQRAGHLIKADRIDEAKPYLQTAARFDPLNSYLHHDLAVANESLFKKTNDRSLLEQARTHYTRTAQLEPNNPNHRIALGNFLLKCGEFEDALKHISMSVELNPMDPRRYEYAGEVYLAVAERYARNEDWEHFDGALKRTVELGEALSKISAAMPDLVPEENLVPPTTPVISLNTGKSLVLLRRFDEAREALEMAWRDSTTKEEAGIWMALALQNSNREEEAEGILRDLFSSNPDLKKDYEGISSTFKLRP